MAAASFALVPSLSVLFAPLLFPTSPPEGFDEDEEEAGMMADRRGAALLFVCCWSIGGDVVAMVSRPEPDGVNPSSPGDGVTW